MENVEKWKKAQEVITAGGVTVLPTDTIYGLHCSALNSDSVERIYKIKGRDFNKPCIVLIGDISDLNKFGVEDDPYLLETLGEYWPGPNSIILPVENNRFSYLHRGTNSLAFRIPAYAPLLDLIKQTGPIVSTSANPSGKEPAIDTESARSYFGKAVDYYLKKGFLDNQPSSVFKYEKGEFLKIR